MRCPECAARVAATARVCSRCGAPIVGQPPAVADMVVDAVSDAAGKALPAVAGKALPEPFVPGSGDKHPAQLRLVLVGYVGVASGLFAVALACAAAALVPYFFIDYVFYFENYVVGGVVGELIDWAIVPVSFLAVGACIWGLWRALKTLKTGIRFSKLLRRPNDASTATVMALERGGRTLILDSNPRDGTGRGYQPLSEVRLALWLKAGMLMPGETVTVYAGTGGKSEMLIGSAQRGRGFLGTVKSRSTVHPGLGPLDEKVSGTTLVDWAAWAALTSFSSTGLRLGYDKPDVDALRSAIRDTFLGVSEPPVKADDIRGKQFPTHRPGYDKTQVDAFLEAARIRLAAMESTDRPEGPLVSDAVRVAWAEWADSTTFSKRSWRDGYEATEVDPFRETIRDTFLGESQHPVRAHDVRSKNFALTTDSPHDGYDPKQVDAFLDAAGIRLAAMESTDRPPEPLVTGTILTDGPSEPTQQDFQPPRWAEWAEWAEWADSTRFSTIGKGSGYDTAEVDAFRQEIGDTFLGVRQPPLTSDEANDKRFRMARRRGYDVQQVDAFCDEAIQRLAAMRPTYRGRRD
jgi:DivIVA domain-containing protein